MNYLRGSRNTTSGMQSVGSTEALTAPLRALKVHTTC